MKMFFATLVLLFSSASFAAPDCFNQHQVRSFRVINSHEVIVEAFRDRYRLQVAFCSELPWAQRIAFNGFGSRVCRGDRLLILDNFSNQVRQSCTITNVMRH